jgi:hypothetical protein
MRASAKSGKTALKREHRGNCRSALWVYPNHPVRCQSHTLSPLNATSVGSAPTFIQEMSLVHHFHFQKKKHTACMFAKCEKDEFEYFVDDDDDDDDEFPMYSKRVAS